MVKHVTANELEQLIQNGDKPVVCDFWANWCGPCRMLAPIFEETAEKYDGKAEFVKLDVDSDGAEIAATKYGITSIPNVIIFKQGQPTANNWGFVPLQVFQAFIEKNI